MENVPSFSGRFLSHGGKQTLISSLEFAMSTSLNSDFHAFCYYKFKQFYCTEVYWQV